MSFPEILLGATTIDPTAGSIIGLIGNLGSAAAAVVVTYLFLTYLKVDGDKRDKRYEDLFARNSDVLKDTAMALREFGRTLPGFCRDYRHDQPDKAQPQ